MGWVTGDTSAQASHLSLVTCHILRVRLGLAETRDAVAGFALAALLEEGGALKTFEDIALATQGGRRAETAML